MKIDNYDMVLGLRDAIRPLHDAGGSFWNDHLEKSFPNAPAAREIAAYNDPEVVGNAFLAREGFLSKSRSITFWPF